MRRLMVGSVCALTALSLTLSVVGPVAEAKTSVGALGGYDVANRTVWYGGYLRSLTTFGTELTVLVPQGRNPSDYLQVQSFLLLGVAIESLQVYLGASPIIVVSPSAPSLEVDRSHAYGKAGVGFHTPPLAAFVQVTALVSFQGSLDGWGVEGGIGIGF